MLDVQSVATFNSILFITDIILIAMKRFRGKKSNCDIGIHEQICRTENKTEN